MYEEDEICASELSVMCDISMRRVYVVRQASKNCAYLSEQLLFI